MQHKARVELMAMRIYFTHYWIYHHHNAVMQVIICRIKDNRGHYEWQLIVIKFVVLSWRGTRPWSSLPVTVDFACNKCRVSETMLAMRRFQSRSNDLTKMHYKINDRHSRGGDDDDGHEFNTLYINRRHQHCMQCSSRVHLWWWRRR